MVTLEEIQTSLIQDVNCNPQIDLGHLTLRAEGVTAWLNYENDEWGIFVENGLSGNEFAKRCSQVSAEEIARAFVREFRAGIAAYDAAHPEDAIEL